MTITHNETATTAYALWEFSGRPNGRDREHWAEAERILAYRDEMLRQALAVERPAPIGKTKATRKPASSRKKAAP